MLKAMWEPTATAPIREIPAVTVVGIVVGIIAVVKNKGLGISPNPLIYLWRRHPDLNRRITVLQTVKMALSSTLPLFTFPSLNIHKTQYQTV